MLCKRSRVGALVVVCVVVLFGLAANAEPSDGAVDTSIKSVIDLIWSPGEQSQVIIYGSDEEQRAVTGAMFGEWSKGKVKVNDVAESIRDAGFEFPFRYSFPSAVRWTWEEYDHEGNLISSHVAERPRERTEEEFGIEERKAKPAPLGLYLLLPVLGIVFLVALIDEIDRRRGSREG